MRTSRPRIERIRTAERQGGDRASEDRIFVAPNAIIVLDGASQPGSSERDGGWLAEQVGSRLRDGLVDSPEVDLETLLSDTIHGVATKFNLSPGAAPSSTVSIVRWNTDTVDVLVLGDSPVVALAVDRRILAVRDDRLSQVAVAERGHCHDGSPQAFITDRPDTWRALVSAQRAMRNRAGGYWIVEASPEAAGNAIRSQFRTRDLSAILAMTDGVAKGVDQYGVFSDWFHAVNVAIDDPENLVKAVHECEESDVDGRRWPRSKRHDDKAVAVICFDASPHH